MRRRDFVAGLGGAAVLAPFAAHAQQARVPVVGYLHSGSMLDTTTRDFEAFRRGLAETGFIDGQNVRIERRVAHERLDQLPALAKELVAVPVDAIYTLGGVAPAMAAKNATATIPIVFTHGSDPVKTGLVASLGRPGGNVTGVSLLTGQITAKRLEILRELVPKATLIAVLANPNSATGEARIADVETAARALKLKTLTLSVGSPGEFDTAFAALRRQRAHALFAVADPLFRTYRSKILLLADRYGLPAIHTDRDTVEAGGLSSYGVDVRDVIRQGGVYIGRILKGEKPADLPVLLPTKFELVINLRTAKALKLEVPLTLQAAATEVIE